MIAKILSLLFPPRLPGQVRDWDARVPDAELDDSWAGPAKRKRYRDGIERHFAENIHPIHRINFDQYHTQLMYAQIEMAAVEKDLIAQGYVNTIHDCWEKPSEDA